MVQVTNDLAKWELFAKGFGWNDAWTTATRYKPNDTVRYGGQVYICVTGHNSAATPADGLEADRNPNGITYTKVLNTKVTGQVQQDTKLMTL